MTYEELKLACEGYSCSINDEIIAKLSRYAAALKEWNEKMNLTSITEENQVIEKHFFDCIITAKTYDFSSRLVADIGSGAGFPGMIIALLFPTSKVTLIDATKKKFAFLEFIKQELDLKNVEFYVGRVEEMKDKRQAYDVVISRGFASMRVFLEVAAPICRISGTIIAMKGSRGDEEMEKAKDMIRLTCVRLKKKEETTLPNGEVRINYFFAKDKATPKRFPRRWCEILLDNKE